MFEGKDRQEFYSRGRWNGVVFIVAEELLVDHGQLSFWHHSLDFQTR